MLFWVTAILFFGSLALIAAAKLLLTYTKERRRRLRRRWERRQAWLERQQERETRHRLYDFEADW